MRVVRRRHTNVHGQGKEVLFIRHGQSMANAAGGEADKTPMSDRWLDAPMTALGRHQADSWKGVAPTWSVDEVICSPLSRAMETACRIFQHCDAPIIVTPHAREGWWHCTENRGRPLAGIYSGTDGVTAEKRWPTPLDLPGSHKLRALDAVQSQPPYWDPTGEAAAAANEDLLFNMWRDGLEELKRTILASQARRLAVVCHWGVIEALTGFDADNCTCVPTLVFQSSNGTTGNWSCSVCPPVIPHPPLGRHSRGGQTCAGRGTHVRAPALCRHTRVRQRVSLSTVRRGERAPRIVATQRRPE